MVVSVVAIPEFYQIRYYDTRQQNDTKAKNESRKNNCEKVRPHFPRNKPNNILDYSQYMIHIKIRLVCY
jgi:hypothetical protein